MRGVLFCILEAVEDKLCLLEVLEMLEVLEVTEVRRCGGDALCTSTRWAQFHCFEISKVAIDVLITVRLGERFDTQIWTLFIRDIFNCLSLWQHQQRTAACETLLPTSPSSLCNDALFLPSQPLRRTFLFLQPFSALRHSNSFNFPLPSPLLSSNLHISFHPL